MRPDQLERRLHERLDAPGPAPRAELLHFLMLPVSSAPSGSESSSIRQSGRGPRLGGKTH